MGKLYANENFPLPVVEELRRLGHDVLTSQEARQSDRRIPDDAVLDFASAQGRALLTINRRHFIRLHQERSDHAGIIVCTLDPDFAALAHRVQETLAANPDLSGQLVRVNRPAPP
jgi:hypothetical protein